MTIENGKPEASPDAQPNSKNAAPTKKKLSPAEVLTIFVERGQADRANFTALVADLNQAEVSKHRGNILRARNALLSHLQVFLVSNPQILSEPMNASWMDTKIIKSVQDQVRFRRKSADTLLYASIQNLGFQSSETQEIFDKITKAGTLKMQELEQKVSRSNRSSLEQEIRKGARKLGFADPVEAALDPAPDPEQERLIRLISGNRSLYISEVKALYKAFEQKPKVLRNILQKYSPTIVLTDIQEVLSPQDLDLFFQAVARSADLVFDNETDRKAFFDNLLDNHEEIPLAWVDAGSFDKIAKTLFEDSLKVYEAMNVGKTPDKNAEFIDQETGKLDWQSFIGKVAKSFV